MLTVLVFLTLVCITIILYGIERRLWGQSVTPFALLAFPFVAVAGCAILLAEPLRFRPVYPEALAIWIIALLIFWAGGYVAYRLIRQGAAAPEKPQGAVRAVVSSFDTLSRRLLLIASWAVILVLSYALLKYSVEIVGRSTAILSDEFQEAYGAGLFGYLRAVAMFLLIILIGEVRKRDYLMSLTIALVLVLLLTSMVKGTIMLPLLGGLLYRLYAGRMRLTIRGTTKVAALLGVLFFTPYLVGALLVDPSLPCVVETLYQVSRKFFLYLFSGVLALGDAMRMNIVVTSVDQVKIFAPLLNLYNNLTGAGMESVRPLTHYNSMIDMDGIATPPSNVHTIFGTLYLFLGPLGSALYTFLLGIFAYVLLFMQRRGNCWFRGLTALIFAALVFGWFEYYFWHTLFIIPAAFGAGLYGWEYFVRLPLGNACASRDAVISGEAT